MKKLLRRLLIFITILIVSYTLLILLWGSSMTPSMFKPNLMYQKGSQGLMNYRLQEVKDKHDLDILFLGASNVYRGIDTRNFSQIGLETFVLASSSQTPMQTKLLLERYLDKLKPKKVIIGVAPSLFNSDGVESSLDIITNDKNDMGSLKMALEINNIKTYNTLLYGYLMDALHKDYALTNTNPDDKYIPGGYVERDVQYYKHRDMNPSEWTYNATQIEYFEDIINLLKAENIDTELIYIPITKDLYKSITNIADFNRMMDSYGDYTNYNESNNLVDTVHFFDHGHLNTYGVDVFNKDLIKNLIRNR